MWIIIAKIIAALIGLYVGFIYGKKKALKQLTLQQQKERDYKIFRRQLREAKIRVFFKRYVFFWRRWRKPKMIPYQKEWHEENQ